MVKTSLFHGIPAVRRHVTMDNYHPTVYYKAARVIFAGILNITLVRILFNYRSSPRDGLGPPNLI
jgi:hypothetical protein